MGGTHTEPHLAGIVFLPNLAVATLFVAAAVAARQIARMPPPAQEPSQAHPLPDGRGSVMTGGNIIN